MWVLVRRGWACWLAEAHFPVVADRRGALEQLRCIERAKLRTDVKIKDRNKKLLWVHAPRLSPRRRRCS